MKKYLNPKNYIRFADSLINRYGLERIEALLAPDADQPLRHPPVFFLGAPRSGSTLAVQVITDALDIGYISNRHAQWFGAPAIAERLFHPLDRRPKSDYQSAHGVTSGSYAPSECGAWWYRFFRRRPAYVTLDEVDPRRMRAFRRSVAALTNAFDRPVLFKNLYASLRIQAIAQYIPESLFIVTHRNEVDNGHSLLEARLKTHGDYERWLSVEPPDTDQLRKLPAYQQVIEQIRHIHATIEKDLALAGVPAQRRFDLNYEDFCAEPVATIGHLQSFLAKNACDVKLRDAIPQNFVQRSEIRIDPDLFKDLATYAQNN